MPAYYQPVKAVGRQVLSGEVPSGWVFSPPSTHGCIFAKETAGPYSLFECLFIPLQLLIEAGYPPDKLHLILLERAPVDSFLSWVRKWSHIVPADILVRHYVIAELNLRRVKQYAERAGVPVTHYAYEASKEPVHAARALFDRLGLSERFTESVVTDWREMGQLESENARVIYPKEPAAYSVPGLHGSDVSYRYHEGQTATLSAAQLEVLARSGVQEVYWHAVEGCVADLGFDADTSARLFGLKTERLSVAA